MSDDELRKLVHTFRQLINQEIIPALTHVSQLKAEDPLVDIIYMFSVQANNLESMKQSVQYLRDNQGNDNRLEHLFEKVRLISAQLSSLKDDLFGYEKNGIVTSYPKRLNALKKALSKGLALSTQIVNHQATEKLQSKV